MRDSALPRRLLKIRRAILSDAKIAQMRFMRVISRVKRTAPVRVKCHGIRRSITSREVAWQAKEMLVDEMMTI